MTHQSIVSPIVNELEQAWNAGDGARFGSVFADDADFVNIRGEYYRTREAIAAGHQGIFDTIYKGSTVQLELEDVRQIAPTVLVARIRSRMNAPSGPLAGRHDARFTIVLVEQGVDWRIAAFHNTLVK